ncbi:hypothetical protein C8F04DRAFT_1255656 [Mycena alexandri]|uniref:Uncharacterized protein n=1 Tax=Mycena alexandri TaxID=1745969 RepID=A0AAD6T2Z4_9AGAR|nr:hypothetical protein C8F04DRAFT_1255656 [Mycena alexandri]
MARTKQVAKKRDRSPTPDEEPPLWDMEPPRMPKAQMMPQAGVDVHPRPSFNDLANQHSLYEHTRCLDWTLHRTLNIPHCRQSFQCAICEAYLKHLQDARLADGLREGKALKPRPPRSRSQQSSKSQSEDDEDEDDESEDDESEDEREVRRLDEDDDSLMDPLFRLKDLRGKIRTLGWFNYRAERSQDAGGFAAISMQLAEVELKKEGALSQNAELQAKLQMVTQHADNTSAELRMRLAEAEKKRDDAVSRNAELEAQLQLVAHHADNTSAELHMRLDEAEKKRDDVLRQNAELQAQLQLVRQYADNSSAELRLRLDGAEKKKEEARLQNAELQIQLQLTTQNADNAYTELRMRLESALSDAANTRADLSLARTDGDQARADRDRALQEVSSAQQQVASLSQELANVDSLRPRKRSQPSAAVLGNRLTFAPGIPLPPNETDQDQLWHALHRMARPKPADDPLLIAHFLQHNEETNFKGIPTSGPEWVIDLRDVRGYREVESRVPGKVKGEGPDARFYRIHSLTRVLEVLAVPGKYSALLSSLDKQVAPIASLTPCVFGPNPFSLSDGEVAALLADKGLTVALADDSWQYCYKHLEAHAARPDQSTTKQLLTLWNTISAAAPAPPPGLQSPAADRYPRTVPSKIRKGR